MQQPQLLIGEYASVEDIKERICNNRFKPLDTSTPTCRFRGTVVQADGAAGTVTVIGWQRNAARLQKMDVSLPTIITVTLKKRPDGNSYFIDSAQLDKRFKGSKGILCSVKYLDRNMRETIVGQAFDSSLIKKTKLKALHCFHLVEVLHGMISYFGTVSDKFLQNNTRLICFEEENLDYLEDGDNRTCLCGYHIVKDKDPVSYQLVFNDLFQKVGFSKDGAITCDGTLSYEFSVRNGNAFHGEIANRGNGLLNMHFQKTLFACVKTVQTAFGFAADNTMCFTNLYPAAFIGLMTQTLAIRHFSNNYQYIMHVLTGLQRQNNIPLCIGSTKNMVEIKEYFPGFSAGDLKE
jgi:hypothetical protein